MSAKPPSKQLGAIFNRVPSATAAGQGAMTGPRSVPYAPAPEPAPTMPEAEPVVTVAREVPLQVLIPEHVRDQLDQLRAKSKKTIRQLTLEALRGMGLDVSDEDIAGKRGRKKLMNS